MGNFDWGDNVRQVLSARNGRTVPGKPRMGSGVDNTLAPLQSGEYVLPVDAVMAIGKGLAPNSQLNPNDAWNIGRRFLDQSVNTLKQQMGNPKPVNKGKLGLGYAQGGAKDDNWWSPSPEDRATVDAIYGDKKSPSNFWEHIEPIGKAVYGVVNALSAPFIGPNYYGGEGGDAYAATTAPAPAPATTEKAPTPYRGIQNPEPGTSEYREWQSNQASFNADNAGNSLGPSPLRLTPASLSRLSDGTVPGAAAADFESRLPAPSLRGLPKDRVLFQVEGGTGKGADRGFTLTAGNMQAALDNQRNRGVIANGKRGSGWDNSGDIGKTVNEIAKDGSGFDISEARMGEGQAPQIRIRGDLNNTAAQALRNRVDWSKGSKNMREYEAQAKYNEEVKQAQRHEAAQRAPKDLQAYVGIMKRGADSGALPEAVQLALAQQAFQAQEDRDKKRLELTLGLEKRYGGPENIALADLHRAQAEYERGPKTKESEARLAETFANVQRSLAEADRAKSEAALNEERRTKPERFYAGERSSNNGKTTPEVRRAEAIMRAKASAEQKRRGLGLKKPLPGSSGYSAQEEDWAEKILTSYYGSPSSGQQGEQPIILPKGTAKRDKNTGKITYSDGMGGWA